jgi:hypothetical protein
MSGNGYRRRKLGSPSFINQAIEVQIEEMRHG